MLVKRFILIGLFCVLSHELMKISNNYRAKVE